LRQDGRYLLDLYMEWISIEDRLPPQELPVLVYFHMHEGSTDRMEVAWLNKEQHFFRDADSLNAIDLNYKVTHWMRLPNVPATDDKRSLKEFIINVSTANVGDIITVKASTSLNLALIKEQIDKRSVQINCNTIENQANRPIYTYSFVPA
jgi:hypothetical protein